MPNFLFPSADRPSTALPGVGDVHDDNIYSSCVLAHGGQGTVKMFVSGQGSPIPYLASSAPSNAPAHYLTYTPVTTVIEQSGQLGNSIGDASIRAIGVTFDLCQYVAATGAPRFWGATPAEVADILSKTRLEVKLSNKRRILGPTWTYPQTGGMQGQIVTTANAQTLGYVQNGPFPTGRRLKSPIEIARTDVLVAEISADAALAFSDTSFAASHAGQATLTWVNMVGTLRSDVR